MSGFSHLSAGTDQGAGLWEPDPDNLEQSLFNQQMFRNMKSGGRSDLVAPTKLAYVTILKDLERLTGLTFAEGIIHTP